MAALMAFPKIPSLMLVSPKNNYCGGVRYAFVFLSSWKGPGVIGYNPVQSRELQRFLNELDFFLFLHYYQSQQLQIEEI